MTSCTHPQLLRNYQYTVFSLSDQPGAVTGAAQEVRLTLRDVLILFLYPYSHPNIVLPHHRPPLQCLSSVSHAVDTNRSCSLPSSLTACGRAAPAGVIVPAFTLSESCAEPYRTAVCRHGIGCKALLSPDSPKEEQGDTVSKKRGRQFCKR